MYVVGQLESTGLLDSNFDALLNHSLFKDLDDSALLKYFASNFPHIFEKESISFLYGSGKLSERPYNVLSEMGVKYLSEVKIDELEYITGLGEKSINEIKNLMEKDS